MKDIQEVNVKNPSEASKLIAIHSNDMELTIEEPTAERWISAKKCENPTIRKITINYFDEHWFDWFNINEFPSVQELKIDYNLCYSGSCNDPSYWVQHNMSAIFSGMQNLKHLYLRTEGPGYDEFNPPFELESADIPDLFCVTALSPKSLRVLKVCEVIQSHRLEELYIDYKNLKSLSAVIHFSQNKEIPKNESIVSLNVHIKDDLFGKR